MAGLMLAINEGLAVSAAAIAWHYGLLAGESLIQARREVSGPASRRLLIERFRHAAALSLLGLGLALGQGWNVVRQIDRPMALEAVAVVYLGTVLALVGSVLLIRIASIARWGERCWIVWSLGIIAMIAYEVLI